MYPIFYSIVYNTYNIDNFERLLKIFGGTFSILFFSRPRFVKEEGNWTPDDNELILLPPSCLQKINHYLFCHCTLMEIEFIGT